LVTLPPALPRRRALILEPALMKRQALKRLLRRFGFERVLEAEAADEALVAIRAEPVDLVLTAWAAPPGISGVPLLRALRRRPADRPSGGDAPALVLLDDGLPRQHVVAAIKAGAAGRLPFPLQAEQFERILSTLPGLAGPVSERRSPREA
jgi:CheY-like chemotaxis protein